MADGRSCPHCQASLPLDLATKCPKCKKRLGAYCFACYATLPDDSVGACPACGRRRWVIGDMAQLPCPYERGQPRQHRWMSTAMRSGKVVHEWRCMKCFAEETVTDAFAHFPEQVAATG